MTVIHRIVVTTATAVLALAGCGAGGSVSSEKTAYTGATPSSSGSLPPKVSRGVQVVVHGPDAVMRTNRDVLGPTEQLRQYMWDYFAYPARPPDPRVRALLRSDIAFAWSRMRKPDLVAPQYQGTLGLAVLFVSRSGDEATVYYCEDHSHLVTFSVKPGPVATPSPEPDRLPLALFTVSWVRTTDPSVDSNTISDKPRWLATDATMVGQDPRCKKAVAAAFNFPQLHSRENEDGEPLSQLMF